MTYRLSFIPDIKEKMRRLDSPFEKDKVKESFCKVNNSQLSSNSGKGLRSPGGSMIFNLSPHGSQFRESGSEIEKLQPVREGKKMCKKMER